MALQRQSLGYVISYGSEDAEPLEYLIRNCPRLIEKGVLHSVPMVMDLSGRDTHVWVYDQGTIAAWRNPGGLRVRHHDSVPHLADQFGNRRNVLAMRGVDDLFTLLLGCNPVPDDVVKDCTRLVKNYVGCTAYMSSMQYNQVKGMLYLDRNRLNEELERLLNPYKKEVANATAPSDAVL